MPIFRHNFTILSEEIINFNKHLKPLNCDQQSYKTHLCYKLKTPSPTDLAYCESGPLMS